MTAKASALKINPEVIQEFQAESLETLDAIEAEILAFKDGSDAQELLQSVFRTIHTLKGSASYLGFAVTKRLAHVFEGLLDHLRKSQNPSPILRDAATSKCFLGVIDCLREMVNDPNREESIGASERFASLLNQLGTLSEQVSGAVASTEAPRVKPPLSGPVAAIKNIGGQQIQKIEACLASEVCDWAAILRCLQTLQRAVDYAHDPAFGPVSLSLEATVQLFSGDASDDVRRNSVFEAIRLTSETLSNYEKGLLGSKQEPLVQANRDAGQKASVIERAEEKSNLKAASERKTIRVDEAVIGELMDLVGELIVTRNSLLHWQSQVSHGSLGDQHLRQLREVSHRLSHIAGEMQSGVSRIRWVPIGTLFSRYNRLIRDLSEQTGKEIDLHISGEETGIDKVLVEYLNEPLVHLIRNSVDHGIETPAERRSKGKPEKGSLRLSAAQKGDRIVIEITDDGKGINASTVGRKAVERGLITDEQLATLTEQEIVNFVFQPGFSTSAQVTEISGRGVGMDAVLHGIKRMNGKVNLTTNVDVGTTVSLEFPLTLAVTEALLIQNQSEVFALPLQSVHEIVRLSKKQISMVVDQAVFSLRGQVVNVVSFGHGFNGQDHLTTANESTVMNAVVVQAGAQKCGLVVDRVLRKEEIVIKPLPPGTTQMRAVTGAAILGDGTAILVIDPTNM